MFCIGAYTHIAQTLCNHCATIVQPLLNRCITKEQLHVICPVWDTILTFHHVFISDQLTKPLNSHKRDSVGGGFGSGGCRIGIYIRKYLTNLIYYEGYWWKVIKKHWNLKENIRLLEWKFLSKIKTEYQIWPKS